MRSSPPSPLLSHTCLLSTSPLGLFMSLSALCKNLGVHYYWSLKTLHFVLYCPSISSRVASLTSDTSSAVNLSVSELHRCWVNELTCCDFSHNASLSLLSDDSLSLPIWRLRASVYLISLQVWLTAACPHACLCVWPLLLSPPVVWNQVIMGEFTFPLCSS